MNLLSAAEVAERLQVPYSVVTNWCRKGQMPGAQLIARSWVIPESSLKGFERPAMGRKKMQKETTRRAPGRPRKTTAQEAGS